MAAAAEEFSFWRMNEVQMRHWVEANPGRVDDRDRYGRTPLYVAVRDIKSLALTVWLVDEKGADVNGPISGGLTSLHWRSLSLDILPVLLDRGADPTLPDNGGSSPLMYQAINGYVESVARLLQDRVFEPLSTCKIVGAIQHSIGPALSRSRP